MHPVHVFKIHLASGFQINTANGGIIVVVVTPIARQVVPQSFEQSIHKPPVGHQTDTPVFSGALERHPGLKLVLGESGIGWVPYVIERMDLEWVNHTPNAQDYKITTRPSEVFSRQVYATYEEDRIGVTLIPEVGVDNVMWASDYPHPDSTFPHSMWAIEEQFATMDPAIKRKVTSETAARLYGFEGAL